MASRAASRVEVEEIIRGYPYATKAWVEVFLTAGYSVAAVETAMETMQLDQDSPLREAEEGVLSREIMQLTADRCRSTEEARVSGKGRYGVRAAVTPSEQTRVLKAVGHVVEPEFRPTRRFGHSGHMVARVVRGCTQKFMYSRAVHGGRVVEVGPDVTAWMLAEDTPRRYTGARPNLTPRDVVRVTWPQVAAMAAENRSGFWNESVVAKAQDLKVKYPDLFRDSRVEALDVKSEYVISNDANYDIRFGDMPVIMARLGARMWLGTMTRAKGLSRATKVTTGTTPNTMATFVADWQKDRIDFKYSSCSGFGYTHRLSEYAKYEENNGFVWESTRAHYVYVKGSESNDDILFFTVARVTKALYYRDVLYTEAAHAGMIEVCSVWAVGDEVSGVPKRFAPVKFWVEELAYSKVMEKRRALDFKGNIGVTLALVRGTSVRYWVNGVPVGVTQKLHQSVSEALSLAVEVAVSRARRATNMVFETAMGVFEESMERPGWFASLLGQVIDVRRVSGTVTRVLGSVWESVRTPVVDAAVAGYKEMVVSVRRLPKYVAVQPSEQAGVFQCDFDGEPEGCVCLEVAGVNAALLDAGPADAVLLEEYKRKMMPEGCCRQCGEVFDEKMQDMGSSCGPEGVVSDTSCSESGTSVLDEERKFGDGESEASSVCGQDCECELCCEEIGSSGQEGSVPRLLEVVSVSKASMYEFIGLSEYLVKALLSAVTVDAAAIMAGGYFSTRSLEHYGTTRVKHAIVELCGGKVVDQWGTRMDSIGAVFDFRTKKLLPVKQVGVTFRVKGAPDGKYYTCSRLKVFNQMQVAAGVRAAVLDGNPEFDHTKVSYVLGVPGAGKTRQMMQAVAALYAAGHWPVLVLAETNAAVVAAVKYGVQFGVPAEELGKTVMTSDRYLMHKRHKVETVFCDEFPAAHMGKLRAACALTWASRVYWCGDAQQIEYDSFQSEFPTPLRNLDTTTIPSGMLRWMCETHRLCEDVCAMWLDKYPAIYPCVCCDRSSRGAPSFKCTSVASVAEVPVDTRVRYMTFSQDEKEVVYSHVGWDKPMEECRKIQGGGLASVHEDQGSTSSRVYLVRTNTHWDRHESKKHPSLYNRDAYALTASTRQYCTGEYFNASDEKDALMRRSKYLKDQMRLELVRRKAGFGEK